MKITVSTNHEFLRKDLTKTTENLSNGPHISLIILWSLFQNLQDRQLKNESSLMVSNRSANKIEQTLKPTFSINWREWWFANADLVKNLDLFVDSFKKNLTNSIAAVIFNLSVVSGTSQHHTRGTEIFPFLWFNFNKQFQVIMSWDLVKNQNDCKWIGGSKFWNWKQNLENLQDFLWSSVGCWLTVF